MGSVEGVLMLGRLFEKIGNNKMADKCHDVLKKYNVLRLLIRRERRKVHHLILNDSYLIKRARELCDIKSLSEFDKAFISAMIESRNKAIETRYSIILRKKLHLLCQKYSDSAFLAFKMDNLSNDIWPSILPIFINLGFDKDDLEEYTIYSDAKGYSKVEREHIAGMFALNRAKKRKKARWDKFIRMFHVIVTYVDIGSDDRDSRLCGEKDRRKGTRDNGWLKYEIMISKSGVETPDRDNGYDTLSLTIDDMRRHCQCRIEDTSTKSIIIESAFSHLRKVLMKYYKKKENKLTM
jgi:hypothetical protein